MSSLGKMAARKRTQDEKNLKLLRELATLSCNKQCFDCRQKGPTYVNMTIGSFVCTTCSGILRGLNPPHRVKSISMTSFTPEDIEFIKSRGNQFCRQVWFGQSDPKVNLGPDSKDEQKIKDFMMQVYDKKKWWIDPSTVAAQTSQIEQSVISPPDKVPLSRLLGNAHPPLYVPSTQPKQTPQVNSFTPNQSSAPTEKKLDLLAEFGGDPFSSSTNGQTKSETSSNFANFDNNPAFSNTGGNDLTSPLDQPFSPPSNAVPGMGFNPSNLNAGPTADFPPPTNNFVASSTGFPPPALSTSTQASLNTTTTTTTTSAATVSANDRYAALADLDTIFSTSSQPSESSKWDNAPASSSTGWQTNTPPTNTTASSTNAPPSAFGGDAGISNPFGGASVGGPAPLWNQQPQQQPVASQAPNQMWGQQQQQPQQPGVQAPAWNQPNIRPQPGQVQAPAWNPQANLQQQQGNIPGQNASWNPATGGQPAAPASWMAQPSGQINQPPVQAWNQQPVPVQSAFSTGNPFQMNQPPINVSTGQASAFPAQTNVMGGTFFPGQSGSSTSTVPSDANSGFANFNTTQNMASGFASFPQQSVTSPPNNQPPAQFPVQNGGFRTGATDNWNNESNTSSWKSMPQAFQSPAPAPNAVGASSAQFANWQQNPGSIPSNPFLGGTGNQTTQRVNSSNPFL